VTADQTSSALRISPSTSFLGKQEVVFLNDKQCLSEVVSSNTTPLRCRILKHNASEVVSVSDASQQCLSLKNSSKAASLNNGLEVVSSNNTLEMVPVRGGILNSVSKVISLNDESEVASSNSASHRWYS
jgi:hypothetical protein